MFLCCEAKNSEIRVYKYSLEIAGSAGTPAFVLSGNRNGSSTNNQGSNGNYWSSTANSSTNAYNLNLNSSSVNPQNNNNKYNGLTVRCVASS
ncbi:hypothetical protein IJH02_00520 [Candidatus Saccharibacteria bacterium]|nr:hypothetical protein [Candidatus Saccharibacteria bacterium]